MLVWQIFVMRTDWYLRKILSLYPEKLPVAVMKCLGLRACIIIFNLGPNKAKVFLADIFVEFKGILMVY